MGRQLQEDESARHDRFPLSGTISVVMVVRGVRRALASHARPSVPGTFSDSSCRAAQKRPDDHNSHHHHVDP